MTHTIIAIFAFVIAILFIILIHELGHYLAAKVLKIKVERFSIGFGKSLLEWKSKAGTSFALTYFPLGGFIKLEPEQFKKENLWKRLIVILAGPVSNFVFAFFLYWLIYSVGYTMPKPIIGNVLPNTIAAKAGLTANDKIVKIDDVAVHSWQDVLLTIFPYYGDSEKVPITVQKQHLSAHSNHVLDLTRWHLNPLKPHLFTSLGIKPWQPAIEAKIKHITPKSSASLAGLKMHDKIIASNGYKISSWQEWIEQLKKQDGKEQELTVLRDNAILKVLFKPDIKTTLLGHRYIKLGFSPGKAKWPNAKLGEIKYDIGYASIAALNRVWVFTIFNADILGKLITGKLSFKILAGPISLFKTVEYTTLRGIMVFLMLMALLSTSVGLINLIPIPGLDGGQAMIICVETLLGKQLSPHIQLLLYRLTLIIIFILFAQALAADLMRVH